MLVDTGQTSILRNIEDHRHETRYSQGSIEKLTRILNTLSADNKIGHLLTTVHISSAFDVLHRVVMNNPYSPSLSAIYTRDYSYFSELLIKKSDTSATSDCNIVICNFSLGGLFRSRYSSLYTDTCHKLESSNIDSKSRIPGYFLNIKSYSSILGEGKTGIFEIQSIGKHDTLFSIITEDCKLCIRWPVLKFILDKYSDKRCKSILKKLFLRFDRVSNYLLSISPFTDMEILEEEITKDVLCQSEGWGSPGSIEAVANQKVGKLLNSDRVKSHRKDIYIYDSVLQILSSNINRTINDKVSEGFKKGLMMATKMAILGWLPSDYMINSLNNGTLWFEKNVNIVPTIIIYGGIHYKIKKDDCPYSVTKLYLSPEGSMRCDGTHPNVNHGSVCMGDLGNIDFNLPEEELSDSIEQAVRLLEIINYDSPYDSRHRETLLKKSVKMDVGEQMITPSSISSTEEGNSTIRKISTTSSSENTQESNVVSESDNDTTNDLPKEAKILVNILDSDENSEKTETLLSGFTSKQWEFLTERLNDIERFCDRDDDGDINYILDSKEYEFVFLFSIANTERYVLIMVTKSTWLSYHSSLIPSDFRVVYFKSQTSLPLYIGVENILDLSEFLEPVYVDGRNRPQIHTYAQTTKNLVKNVVDRSKLKFNNLMDKVESFHQNGADYV